MPGTLVFPLATTTVWYLLSLASPWGTALNPAYTQYGDLPLLQLLALTGVWGIVFLMGWLASMVNWAWMRDFAWPRARGGLALYGGLFAAILLLGGARLAFLPPQGSTVRTAGVSPSPALVEAANQQIQQLPTRCSTGSSPGLLDAWHTQTYGLYFAADPWANLEPLTQFTSGSTTNYRGNNGGYLSDAYTKLVEAAAGEVDPAKRKQIYSRLNDFLLDEAFVYPLWSNITRAVAKANLKDLGHRRNEMWTFYNARLA
jgi:hypothetical protein